MMKIKNIEEVISVSKDWKPSDLAFIKKLELSHDQETLSVINLVIVFLSQIRNTVKGWPDKSKEFFEISIAFTHVSNIHLDFSGSSIYQISGFDIIDVSENEWEAVNFKVEDYENGTIDFNCKNIIVTSVSNPSIVVFN